VKPNSSSARQTAHVALYLKRLPQAKEVVGLIIQANERTFQSAHAARQANAVLALLFKPLPSDRLLPFLVSSLRSVSSSGFECVKIVQLVQAKDADVPHAAVEDLPFLHQQLTTNNRSRVVVLP